jgi:hypothetical protein
MIQNKFCDCEELRYFNIVLGPHIIFKVPNSEYGTQSRAYHPQSSKTSDW